MRVREERLDQVTAELHQVRAGASACDVPLDIVIPEVQRRLQAWHTVLTEESTQARQMLRRLLRGRWVFLPHLEQRTCEFVGEGDLSEVFRGLINVPKALASPTGSTTGTVVGLVLHKAA